MPIDSDSHLKAWRRPAAEATASLGYGRGVGRWLCLNLCAAFAFLSAASAVQAASLTAQERQYLNHRGPITMCVDPDWEPFEKISDADQHVGIAADLIELVALSIGAEIVLHRTESWDESLLASQAGQCDLLSFLNQTPDRDEWLIFTEPLFFDSNVIITRADHPAFTSPLRLEDQTVALPFGTMVAERIQRDFPRVYVIPTASEAEAIDLVSRGVVDLTVRSLVVAAYTIKQEGLFNLKVSARMPGYDNALRIGVRQDQTILRDILNKGVATITDEQRDEISNRHAAISLIEQVNYRIIWEIVAASLLVVTVLLYLFCRERQLSLRASELANKQIEHERRARQEQRRLVAMLSHEIKTPLAMIDGAAQAIKHLASNQSPDVTRRIDRIRRATARLVGLSDQLLMKDRLEDETLCVHPQDFAFDELVLQVIDELAASDRIKLGVQGQTMIFGDPVLIKVLLQNLISNALKYSDSQVEVQVRGDAQQLVFRVLDQGPGISQDLRSTLFDQYVRGTHLSDIEGSGLGLYLCARIVALHGGSIELGQPERGAEFVVQLPLRFAQG